MCRRAMRKWLAGMLACVVVCGRALRGKRECGVVDGRLVAVSTENVVAVSVLRCRMIPWDFEGEVRREIA